MGKKKFVEGNYGVMKMKAVTILKMIRIHTQIVMKTARLWMLMMKLTPNQKNKKMKNQTT